MPDGGSFRPEADFEKLRERVEFLLDPRYQAPTTAALLGASSVLCHKIASVDFAHTVADVGVAVVHREHAADRTSDR